MEIPKSFQLMGHPWTVEHVHGVFDVDGDACNGVCCFATLTIRVNIDNPPSLVRHSFMHEVMHAVLWTLGHALATDEGFVDGVGAALAQVLTSAE